MEKKKSHIFEDILIALPVLFAVYLAAVAVYRSIIGSVFYVEMGVCLLLTAFAVCLRFRLLKRLPGWLAWVLRVLMIAIVAFVAALILIVCSGAADKADKPADYAVVLGVKLMRGEAVQDLVYRTDECVRYASAHPETLIIVSGGNGSDTQRSEAEVMRELLMSRGIPAERILTEDRSSDTKENLAYTAELTGTDKSLVIITSGYHVRRAAGLAKKIGFTSLQGQSAPQELWLLPANVMWEAVCWFDSLIKGDIAI